MALGSQEISSSTPNPKRPRTYTHLTSNSSNSQAPPPRYRQTPEIAHVLRVAKYLDPVSRMSLKYTSQYLYHGLKYTIASELWYPKPRPKPTLGPNSQVRDSIPGEAARQKRITVDLARERRLRLLTLLVKDGLFGDGKSICAPCLSVHEDSLFLPSELEKPDREREYLDFTGKVWICPHLQLHYDELTLSNPRPSRPHPPHPDRQYFATDSKGKKPAAKLGSSQPSYTTQAQPHLSSAEAKRAHRRAKQDTTNILGTTPVSKIKQECYHCASRHVTTTSFTKSKVCFPIMYLRPHILARASTQINGAPPLYQPRTSLPSSKAVSASLKGMEAPICPHLKTSDAVIMDAYERTCMVLEQMGALADGDEYKDADAPRILGVDFVAREKWGKKCTECHARWFFDIKVAGPYGEKNWKKMLGLTVKRDLRDAIEKGVMDPKWLVQLVQPELVETGVEGKEVDAREVDMGRNWDDALRVCGAFMHVSDWMETHYKGCPGCLNKEILKP